MCSGDDETSEAEETSVNTSEAEELEQTNKEVDALFKTTITCFQCGKEFEGTHEMLVDQNVRCKECVGDGLLDREPEAQPQTKKQTKKQNKKQTKKQNKKQTKKPPSKVGDNVKQTKKLIRLD